MMKPAAASAFAFVTRRGVRLGCEGPITTIRGCSACKIMRFGLLRRVLPGRPVGMSRARGQGSQALQVGTSGCEPIGTGDAKRLRRLTEGDVTPLSVAPVVGHESGKRLQIR